MFEPLQIGELHPRFPLIQGGMGIRVSAGNLAGHVARCGGIGLIATAGIGRAGNRAGGEAPAKTDCKALASEIRKAHAIAPNGIVGINAMMAVRDYEAVIQAACEAGAQLVVSGAGLPLSLPGVTADFPSVALLPIVSSVKAAALIAKKWHRRFDRLPDAVVVEDPDTAGGHLGEKLENIGTGTYDQYATVRGVRDLFLSEWGRRVPVIAAGGVWSAEDLRAALAQGADGVQMASRFVCTEECDAAPEFKQAYLDCTPEDIGLMASPAGLPGRALIRNMGAIHGYDVDHRTRCRVSCLKKCTYRDTGDRFCILGALERSRMGEVDTGLVFCGTNAWRSEKITTVEEVFVDLFGEIARLPEASLAARA